MGPPGLILRVPEVEFSRPLRVGEKGPPSWEEGVGVDFRRSSPLRGGGAACAVAGATRELTSGVAPRRRGSSRGPPPLRGGSAIRFGAQLHSFALGDRDIVLNGKVIAARLSGRRVITPEGAALNLCPVFRDHLADGPTELLRVNHRGPKKGLRSLSIRNHPVGPVEGLSRVLDGVRAKRTKHKTLPEGPPRGPRPPEGLPRDAWLAVEPALPVVWVGPHQGGVALACLLKRARERDIHGVEELLREAILVLRPGSPTALGGSPKEPRRSGPTTLSGCTLRYPTHCHTLGPSRRRRRRDLDQGGRISRRVGWGWGSTKPKGGKKGCKHPIPRGSAALGVARVFGVAA